MHNQLHTNYGSDRSQSLETLFYHKAWEVLTAGAPRILAALPASPGARGPGGLGHGKRPGAYALTSPHLTQLPKTLLKAFHSVPSRKVSGEALPPPAPSPCTGVSGALCWAQVEGPAPHPLGLCCKTELCHTPQAVIFSLPQSLKPFSLMKTSNTTSNV